MSTVVSIRVDDATLEAIKKMGYNPGEYLSQILQAQLRLERSRASLKWFKRNRFRSRGETGTEMIRKDRDSR